MVDRPAARQAGGGRAGFPVARCEAAASNPTRPIRGHVRRCGMFGRPDQARRSRVRPPLFEARLAAGRLAFRVTVTQRVTPR